MGNHFRTAPHVLEPYKQFSEEDVEVPVYLPRYATCHASIVVTGKEGRGPGELYAPYGLAIHEDTHEIFVANLNNDRVEVFSETGEFLYQLGVGQLSQPWGITTHGGSVYVSCVRDHTVSKFSLTEMCRVRRIGGEGSDNGQFNNPSQLTTDPIGRVFIADRDNNRICIHDPDLNHLCNISLQPARQPFDVKVLRDRLYVMCHSSPCMLALTLEGDQLHYLVTRAIRVDVLCSLFFCLDPLNNFVLRDFRSHSIRVSSPEGNLLQTIRREGRRLRTVSYPRGVAITPNERLVCVSGDEKYGLEIFS